jgi:hypothetical protein
VYAAYHFISRQLDRKTSAAMEELRIGDITFYALKIIGYSFAPSLTGRL